MDDHRFNSYIARLRNVNAIYRQLEIDYDSLPLSSRRHIFGSEHQSAKDLKILAQAKFYTAAILQWSPTTYGFRYQSFVDCGAASFTRGGDETNEICPVWAAFFEDVAEADVLLSSSSKDAAAVELLVTQAETKMQWVRDMVALLQRHGEVIARYGEREISQDLLYEGWNRFCLRIFHGEDLEVETTWLRELKRPLHVRPRRVVELPAEMRQRDGKRCWLITTFSAEPWVTMVPYLGFEATNMAFRRSAMPNQQSQQLTMENHRHQRQPRYDSTTPPPGGWFAPREPGYDNSITIQRPHSPEPHTKLPEYNHRWECLSPTDFNIPFPHSTFSVDVMNTRAGLKLPGSMAFSLPWLTIIHLKVTSFYISSFYIDQEWIIEADGVPHVVPNLETCGIEEVRALLLQMRKEQERWDAKALSFRSGVEGLLRDELGDDFVSVAIRAAVKDLGEKAAKKVFEVTGRLE